MVTGFGDPAAVEAAARDLNTASEAADGAHTLVSETRPAIWQGAAADAFSTAARDTLPAAERLSTALGEASGTLTRYAAVQRQEQSGYESAQSTFDDAVRSLRSNPLDVGAAVDVVRSRMAAFGAIGRLQQAAATAADELRTASGEDADARPWWDPFGWFNDAKDPDERVSDNVLDDDAFDPDDVSQGGIGDCFMLSTIVSLLNSEGGDDFIRENVRWDPDKNGYWVTLYSNGEPTEVFVEYVFDNGAKQNDWQWGIFGGDKPSIAALYEAAIREKYGYDEIDGGVPADAFEMITGHQVDTIENDENTGLSESQVDELRDVLDDGGQVVLSSPRDGEHHITVTGEDGSTREVEIVTTHAYAVTRIEADGSVWVRNPWGPGNSADGGGEFRVSAEDVADLFWRAASTNVTE